MSIIPFETESLISSFNKEEEIVRDNSYLVELVSHIEKCKDDNIILPFKILEIKEHGFVIKVCGLFAFIHFAHMPWTYSNEEFWEMAFPYLKNKIFLCRIHKIDKETLHVIIDGKVQIFKDPDLILHEEYKAIVLNHGNQAITIEIGYHFNWRFGSIISGLPKTAFKSLVTFINIKEGEEIIVTYEGILKNNSRIFRIKQEPIKLTQKEVENKELLHSIRCETKKTTASELLEDWYSEEMDEIVGTTVWVKVTVSNKLEKEYWVYGHYKGNLPLIPYYYSDGLGKIIAANEKLSNGDIIQCEVIRINRESRDITLRWIIGGISTKVYKRLENLLSMDVLMKLIKIRNKI